MDGHIEQNLLRETVDEQFEHAPCGYLATLPDGTIVQANQTFLEWIACSREQLLASGRRFQDLLTLPGRIYHDTHYAPLIQMQGSVKEVAFDLVRPEQEALPVIVNAALKRNAAGQPLLTRITVFDATDRRTYERELLSARRKADQLAEAERLAREEALRAGRVKDEFLTLVSHELRTPLNAILGWTQILQRDASLSEDQREGLGVIERNTRIQVQLVNDLLDMGRVDSGKMRLDVQQVELAEIIAGAMETARPAADAKGVRLQNVLDPGVIVAGDPSRLQQIFWNLLSNAIKFTPKSGFIRVVMQRVNSHVEVSVIDSGQGMKPDFLEHAFERFRQSDATGIRKTGGLGLGLSLVKNLVEMHGGSVEARSEGEGKGSTFIVKLPVTVVHAASEDQVHPRNALASSLLNVSVSLRGVRVLVIDDEHDARVLLRRILVDCGAEVAMGASAAEAVRLVEQMRPDVLISDIGIPDVDGYELIRRVRMLGEGAGGVRAIALTAFARLEDRTRAMLAGYQMHLAKPVDPKELIVTVANLAGRLTPPV